jgi:starch phosphorylase
MLNRRDDPGDLEARARMSANHTIAYFSMEIGLEASIPTYAGGLGVLAGDTLRSAADLNVPMVGVSLLHRKGYCYQRLDATGWQTEDPVAWVVGDFLEEISQRATVTIEGRAVAIRCWKHVITGTGGGQVPVYLLDTDLPNNSDWDRTLTDHLYGGDPRYRLCQEVVLGIGGVRILRALGYTDIERFHMNEGHAGLLTLELLDEEARKAGRTSVTCADIEAVRGRCIFTTHTPVPAGHDQFPIDMVGRVLGPRLDFLDMHDALCMELVSRILHHPAHFHDFAEVTQSRTTLNMTFLALNLSGYVNGVAKRHAEVSRLLFAGYAINAITNGVHAVTWTSQPFRDLFDRHIPGWRQDNFSLRSALSIPRDEVWQAHMQAKQRLIHYANRQTNAGLDKDDLTIGFARRVTPYKRADLLFSDMERLRGIAARAGTLQVIYAGKAHPQDQAGKEMIQRIFRARDALRPDVRIAYVENYDMELARDLTSGVDVWLNTPEPPLEASGTSGMKAALNGVPSLSVLDGWWIEGHIEGKTGWSIGGDGRGAGSRADRDRDAGSLYAKLETAIIPLFSRDRGGFVDMMAHTIALNGSFFNTHRMVEQYVLNAYFR